MREQIFISYRRDGGADIARMMCEALKVRNYSVFFDFDSIHGGCFDDRILDAIENCSDFVLVLSKNALARCVNEDDWVRQEIAFALKCGKNIVPVKVSDFVYPTDLPEDIADISRHNAVDYIRSYYDDFISKLIGRLVSKPDRDKQEDEIAKEKIRKEIAPLIIRMYDFLEGKDWASAIKKAEDILDKDPTCPKAYLGRIMGELKISKEETLGSAQVPSLSQNPHFRRACKHATADELKYLKAYEHQNNYAHGLEAMKQAKSEKEFKDAAQWFAANPAYEDSKQLLEDCLRQADLARKEVLYQEALKLPLELQADAFAEISGYKDASERRQQISLHFQSLKLVTSSEFREIISAQKDMEERIETTQKKAQSEYQKLEDLREDARKKGERKASDEDTGKILKSSYSVLTETVKKAQLLRNKVTATLDNTKKALNQTVSLAQESIKLLSDKNVAYVKIQSICDSDLANARTQLQEAVSAIDEASRDAEQLKEIVTKAESAYYDDLNEIVVAGLRAIIDLKRDIYSLLSQADQKVQDMQARLDEVVSQSREKEEKELSANRKSAAKEIKEAERIYRGGVQKIEPTKEETKQIANDAEGKSRAMIAVLSGTGVPFSEIQKAYEFTLPELQASIQSADKLARCVEQYARRIMQEMQKMETALREVQQYRAQRSAVRKERGKKVLTAFFVVIPILALGVLLFWWLTRGPVSPPGPSVNPETTTANPNSDQETTKGNGIGSSPEGWTTEENSSDIPETTDSSENSEADPFETEPVDIPDMTTPDSDPVDDPGVEPKTEPESDPWEEPETEPEAVTAPPRELLEPGLYDENNFEIASWDELVNVYGLDVTKTYSYTSYQNDSSCMNYILTHNRELSKGTTLVIGNVSSIGTLAFDRCNQLTTVILRDGVTSIGKNAFHMCKNVTNFEFTKTVEKIERGAFLECTSLKDVYYIGTLENWCHITIEENGNPCSNGADLYIDRKLVEYVTIPESVQAIPGYAFFGCTSIQHVTLSRNLQTVGTAAFESCVNLEEVSVSHDSRLSTISAHAFMGCTSLVSIEIPTSVKTIGNLSFKNCSSLSEIRFHGSSAQWKAISFGYDWSMYTGDFVIECTDATIAK